MDMDELKQVKLHSPFQQTSHHPCRASQARTLREVILSDSWRPAAFLQYYHRAGLPKHSLSFPPATSFTKVYSCACVCVSVCQDESPFTAAIYAFISLCSLAPSAWRDNTKYSSEHKSTKQYQISINLNPREPVNTEHAIHHICHIRVRGFNS